jgi:serine/threonine protein kinase
MHGHGGIEPRADETVPDDGGPHGGAEVLDLLAQAGPTGRISLPTRTGELLSDAEAQRLLPPRRTLAYGEDAPLDPSPAGEGSDASSSDQVSLGLRGPKSSSDVTMLESKAPLIGHAGDAPADAPDGARPDFVLRERIGKGGQGEVWTALQTSLDREVAVKIVRTSRNKSRLMSFLHEAYTSAELDHPNIVPIHELSQTEINGRTHHLLAMKLVRGRQWDEMLREDREADEMSTESFLAKHLAIFNAICNAVSYAHSKNIAHLDIKPSQVIAGRFGQVYLVDWGLAMTMSEDSARTSSGEVPKFRSRSSTAKPLGTPAYMAPEQASAQAFEIGFRTDVYLLGATLFEIVAGYPPHNGFTGTKAFEMARDNQVAALPMNVPAELARILHRALATDPGERFASVEDLRVAVQEFQIGAGNQRESRQYTEDARRYIAMLGPDPRYAEFVEAERLVNKAITLWPNNAEAVLLRDEVTVRYAEAAIESRDLRLAATLLPFISERTRRMALEGRLNEERERQRAARRQNQVLRAAVVALLAVFVATAGFYIAHLNRSRATIAKVAADLELANAQMLDSNRRARAAQDQAEALVSFLIEDLQETLEPIGRLDVLAKVSDRVQEYYATHDADVSQPAALLNRSIAWRQVGVLLVNEGDLAGARQAFEKYRDGLEVLAARFPEEPDYRARLADSLSRLGRVFYAERDMHRALETDRRARDLREQLLVEDPTNSRWKDDFALSLNNLGVDLWRLGELEPAVEHLEYALRIREELVRIEPASTTFRSNLSWTQGTLGVVLNDLGRGAEGLELHLASRELLQGLIAEDPGNAEWMRNLAWANGSIGEAHEARREWDAALEAFERGLGVREALARQDPRDARLKGQLAWSHNKIGGVHQALGRHAEALASYERAAAIREELAASAPLNANLQEQLGWSRMRLGTLHLLMGSTDDALASFREAERLYRDMRAASPNFQDYRLYLAGALRHQADILATRGEDAAAAAARENALAEIEDIAADSGQVEYRQLLATLLIQLGRVDDARPHAAWVLGHETADPAFATLCREAGIETPEREEADG